MVGRLVSPGSTIDEADQLEGESEVDEVEGDSRSLAPPCLIRMELMGYRTVSGANRMRIQ